MTLQVTSVELIKESRKTSFGDSNVSQIMKFALNGNFADQAGQTGDIWNSNDDHWVLDFIYWNFPWFREFPTPNGIWYLFLTQGEIEQISHDCWVATLTYDIPEAGSSGTNHSALREIVKEKKLGPGGGENNGNDWTDELTQLSFNTVSQLGKINTSRLVVEQNKALSLPAGMGLIGDLVGKPGAIGASENGIEGTEIHKREFSFQITQYFTPTKLKYSYVRRLYRISTCINDDVFFGFPPGTVLFVGATASGNLIQNVPVTFEFIVRPNFKFVNSAITKLSDPNIDDPKLMYDTLGDAGFGPTVADYIPNLGVPGVHSGWCTVDYRYSPVADDTAKIIVQRPTHRIIHLNHEFANFDKLDL